VRPAFKAALPPPAAAARGGQLNVVADDAVALPNPNAPQLEAPRNNERLDTARAVAKDNPAAVAHIVRDWVKGEA
jgi:flagellar M-ring protein FliF